MVFLNSCWDANSQKKSYHIKKWQQDSLRGHHSLLVSVLVFRRLLCGGKVASSVVRGTKRVSKCVHFVEEIKINWWMNFYFTWENNRIVGFTALAAHESHRITAKIVKHLEWGGWGTPCWNLHIPISFVSAGERNRVNAVVAISRIREYNMS